MDTPSVNMFGSVVSITSPSKDAIPRVPSERSIRLKELLANNWVNDQLNIQKISATDLLKKIKKIVPTNLSLQLVLNH